MTTFRNALGAVWRSLIGSRTRRILGRRFRVVPEARGSGNDRDWPVLRALARGRRQVWDVGANLGLTSLLMADVLAEGGRLTAFEASEVACLAIQDNARLNSLEQRIEVVNTVLADRAGTLPFFWQAASGGASIQDGYLSSERRRLVKASSNLDSLAREFGPPDLIKLDVEGAEVMVIEGGLELLSEHGPRLVVELHPFGERDLGCQAAEILRLLAKVGYRMVYLRTLETVDDVEVLRRRGRTHVLLLGVDEEIPAEVETLDRTTI